MPIIFQCDQCRVVAGPEAAWLQVVVNAEQALFCGYTCLSQWATDRITARTITKQNVAALADAAEAVAANYAAHNLPDPSQVREAPPLQDVTDTVSARCQQGQHFKSKYIKPGEQDVSSDQDVGSRCDGAITVSLTATGAPDRWVECACECHATGRMELLDKYNTDPKYREFLGAPLVIS